MLEKIKEKDYDFFLKFPHFLSVVNELENYSKSLKIKAPER